MTTVVHTCRPGRYQVEAWHPGRVRGQWKPTPLRSANLADAIAKAEHCATARATETRVIDTQPKETQS